MEMPYTVLVIHFFTNQIQIQFNPIQKVELDSFFFYVKTGPNARPDNTRHGHE